MRNAGRGTVVRALVSWEDTDGTTHRFQIAYDPDDAEARYFLEGLELRVRFRLETFDVDRDNGPAADGQSRHDQRELS
jgi:hypothetical protein